MSSEKFTFKQFEVWHDKCGMKVGTDGVLLGAWADLSGCRTMLDIGTGTGLIALIAAQRNPRLHVTAIDIMPSAVEQARENVMRSPFKDRIDVKEMDFLAFNESSKFDVVVSNPPFYDSDIHSPLSERDIARHSSSLPLEALMARGGGHLSATGRLSLVLPYSAASDAIGLAYMHGLQLSRRTDVCGSERKAPKRCLLEFVHVDAECMSERSRLVIRNGNEYTEEYRRLTEEFYVSLR